MTEHRLVIEYQDELVVGHMGEDFFVRLEAFGGSARTAILTHTQALRLVGALTEVIEEKKI